MKRFWLRRGFTLLLNCALTACGGQLDEPGTTTDPGAALQRRGLPALPSGHLPPAHQPTSAPPPSAPGGSTSKTSDPFFERWSNVSEGLLAAPGTPITAVPWGDWPFAVFATGADGGIYTAAPNPDRGLPAPWARLPGAAAPGTPVTAVPWGNSEFALFVTGTDTTIYTAAGDPQRGLAGPWATTNGAAALGTAVTAVPWDFDCSGAPAHPCSFALFVTGTDGGIYMAAGDPQRGLAGPWATTNGATAPGGAVTAVPWDFDCSGAPAHPCSFALFVTGTDGGIYTAAGDPQRGLAGPWARIGDLVATPGAPVTAVPWAFDCSGAPAQPCSFALFVTGSDGSVWTAAGDPQRGLAGPWAQVSGVTVRPGSRISAVPWGTGFALFVPDLKGIPYSTVGDPQAGFGRWWPVASTTLDGQNGGPTIPPGASITAANTPITGSSWATRISLFVTGTDGKVYSTSSCCGPPTAPTELRVDSVTSDTIDISWRDDGSDADGFTAKYTGKRAGFSDDTGTQSFGPGARTASLTGLSSGYDYTIQVEAFNAYGKSSSNSVRATTREDGVVTISLQNQHLTNPNGPVPVAYAGQYPAFGTVPPGHVLQIALPQNSAALGLKFVKIGGSTDDCLSSDPSKVVTVLAGHATTSDQLKQIYGVDKPPYSTSSPVPFVACLISSQASSIPEFVQILATIVSDGGP